MLTNEDIELIQLMIDERIKASKVTRAVSSKDYHTVNAIRDLIRTFLPEFRQFVRSEPFPLETLRTFLRARTELLPRDTEVNPGDTTCDRFDRQVANAVDIDHWPDCPIKKSESRDRRYELVVP